MSFTNGAPSQVRRDSWRTERSLDYGYALKGKTVFTERKGQVYANEKETQEARTPKELPMPKQPTPQERDRFMS